MKDDQLSRGERCQTIKGGTYIECFQKSDIPLTKSSCVLGPHWAVLYSTNGLKEGIGSCAAIHLVSSSISGLQLMLAQRYTVCTVIFKKMCMFQA